MKSNALKLIIFGKSTRKRLLIGNRKVLINLTTHHKKERIEKTTYPLKNLKYTPAHICMGPPSTTLIHGCQYENF